MTVTKNNKLFIFSSVGSRLDINYRQQVFDSWNISSFDNGCVIFKPNCKFNYSDYFDNTLNRLGFKFPNFFYFLRHYPILDQYKYFAVIDDDLLFHNIATFTSIYDYMEKLDLSICSPSNDGVGKKSYELMLGNKQQKEIWITNFCEMGCMVIRNDLLKIIIQKYIEEKVNIVDYGFDWFICNIANTIKARIGLIKNLNFYNPYNCERNIGLKEYKNNKNIVHFIQPKVLEKINA